MACGRRRCHPFAARLLSPSSARTSVPTRFRRGPDGPRDSAENPRPVKNASSRFRSVHRTKMRRRDLGAGAVVRRRAGVGIGGNAAMDVTKLQYWCSALRALLCTIQTCTVLSTPPPQGGAMSGLSYGRYTANAASGIRPRNCQSGVDPMWKSTSTANGTPECRTM